MGTGITEEHLKQKLEQEIGATYTCIKDLSDGCGAKFDAVIVSPQFDGKTLINRHRMVNSAIEEEMKTIHAFTMKTYTPAQWQDIQAKSS